MVEGVESASSVGGKKVTVFCSVKFSKEIKIRSRLSCY